MKKLILGLVFILGACSYFDNELARYSNPQNPKQYVSLSKNQGHCPQGTQEMKIVVDEVMPGCYIFAGDNVLIKLDDGPMLLIPKERFTFR